MAKLSEKEKINQYIEQLEPSLGTCVNYLRQFILGIDPEIEEQLKWNSPSFYYKGEMKPFDPKTYQRDILVCNLHKGRLMLVFPTGAKLTTPHHLLEGDYKDGRRIVNFKDLNDIKAKEEDLAIVIKEWLSLVEK